MAPYISCNGYEFANLRSMLVEWARTRSNGSSVRIWYFGQFLMLCYGRKRNALKACRLQKNRITIYTTLIVATRSPPPYINHTQIQWTKHKYFCTFNSAVYSSHTYIVKCMLFNLTCTHWTKSVQMCIEPTVAGTWISAQSENICPPTHSALFPSPPTCQLIKLSYCA